ncbi:MAG: sulfatase, partial [Planctomycetaceae bacterium]|nr:sulfatase [Planctomycetaceae bacterium]
MKSFRLSALLASLFPVLILCLCSSSLIAAPAVERPNILMIYLDDFGWKDAGFMGSDFFETPHLDQLAAGGMIFTHAYSGAANCAPARACLLSGQYTPRHQVFNVGTGPRGKTEYRRLLHVPGVDVLNPKITTWAQLLQQSGYQTATIGKWHLSNDPLPYGFDFNIAGTHSGSPPRGYYPPHNVPGLESAPRDEYLTDRLSQEACRFIEQNVAKPWMLYLPHFAVHTPLDAKRELVAKYQAKPKGKLHHHVAMATMIEAVDTGVGQILETLSRLKLTENTVIIFYSDNGGLAGVTDMDPLRGYKGTYYEGGIRVPFFVNWPGVVTPGTTCEIPITGVDLYPTLCEIGKVQQTDQVCDGLSIVPLLKGRYNWPERPLFWHFPAYLQASGKVEGAESRDPLFRSRPCSVVRHGPWKLLQFFEDREVELYHLFDDPGESRNLAGSQPEIAEQLLATLVTWQQQVQAL